MIRPRDYLSRPPDPPTAQSTIVWWEKRRLYYNLILVAEILLFSFTQHPSDINETLFEGFVLLLIPANFWYLGGWVAEVLVRLVWRRLPPLFGPVALALGTLFSLAFVWFMLDWIPRQHYAV